MSILQEYCLGAGGDTAEMVCHLDSTKGWPDLSHTESRIRVNASPSRGGQHDSD